MCSEEPHVCSEEPYMCSKEPSMSSQLTRYITLGSGKRGRARPGRSPAVRHPVPCNLHPTPYTLHPTPHTLRHTPFTPHPAPRERADAGWVTVATEDEQDLAAVLQAAQASPAFAALT